jgi:hypothetical protein
MSTTTYATHTATFGFGTSESVCLTAFTYSAEGYYGQQGTVMVTFTKGGTYVYENVYFRDAMAVQMAYMEEDSVGQAFARCIRDKYKGERA